MFGVVEKVDQDLQHLVLVHLDGFHGIVLADDPDLMPRIAGGIDADRVLDQVLER